MGNYESIANVSRKVRVTFQTNAAWQQRVSLFGPGINEVLEGRGEGVTHFDKTIPGPVVLLVHHEYKRDGQNAWAPGKVQRINGKQIRFEDGGGDDFQDAVVTLSDA